MGQCGKDFIMPGEFLYTLTFKQSYLFPISARRINDFHIFSMIIISGLNSCVFTEILPAQTNEEKVTIKIIHLEKTFNFHTHIIGNIFL
uniref:Uncharacterized protein n=1 Tax=Heterorhabditis bacteriophora TaxID=37862 RepID=A0A1I7WKK1_HETBA